MTDLLKLANKIEASLRKQAADYILQQINSLLSAAWNTFQFKKEVAQLLSPDSDIYESGGVQQANGQTLASLHKIMEAIYFGASALKEAALKKGLSQADMASRKNRIISLCDQAAGILQQAGVGKNTFARLGFDVVRAKAEQLQPVNLPAVEKVAPVAPAEETGSAYLDEDPTRFYREDPSDDDLQKALQSIRPKKEFKLPEFDADEFNL